MSARMKSGERRASIVRSAIRLFAEKGFHGVTTRELAAAIGVTEPVLYRHFRTKRALYSAIIEATTLAVSEHSSGLLHLARAGNDRAFFVALGELVLDQYEKAPETSRLLLYSCLERHELSEMFFERLSRDFYGLVSSYIRKRIRAGAFRGVDPRRAARGLIGMISYHGLVRLLFPGKIGEPDRRRVVEEMVAIFLEGISI